jgi:dihydrofolate reductase
MIISLIAALDESGGIGLRGQLPWRLPDDLKHFRALTLKHHVIVGRKTYESIGRPLPGRLMIIVSHQSGYRAEGCQVYPSLEEALEMARQAGENEVFMMGGGSLYEQSLSLADRLYLTRVNVHLEADVFFPFIHSAQWQVIDSFTHPVDERHVYAFTFCTLERVK